MANNFSRRRMVRRRRFTRKRRGFKRARPMTAKRVRRMIGAELKHLLFGITSAAPAVVGDRISLTDGVPQGVTVTQRIGDWIKPINIHGNLTVQGDNGGNPVVVNVRAFFIQWLENASTALPDLEDLIENTTAPQGPYKFSAKGQFKVIWSRVFNIVNEARNPQFAKKLPFYINVSRNMKSIYNGPLATKGHYYFFIFSETDAVGAVPTYRLDATLRYTDS